ARLKIGLELLNVAHRDGVDDGLLVWEEPVQRADRQLGFGGNASGRDVLQRHLAEQGTGSIEHPLDGLLAARLHGSAPGSRREFLEELRRIYFIHKGRTAVRVDR